RRAGRVVRVVFFFFQAEDGIRDWSVTGVQTCALPIWIDALPDRQGPEDLRPGAHPGGGGTIAPKGRRGGSDAEAGWRRRQRGARSEERRVGKECRTRWAPRDDKKERERKSGQQITAKI